MVIEAKAVNTTQKKRAELIIKIINVIITIFINRSLGVKNIWKGQQALNACRITMRKERLRNLSQSHLFRPSLRARTQHCNTSSLT